MGAATGFQAHQARRPLCQQRQDLLACHLLVQHDVAVDVDAMELPLPLVTSAVLGCRGWQRAYATGYAALCAWGRRLLHVLPKVTRPGREIVEQLPDQVLARGIRKVALHIKALRRIANHHFRAVERMHVQKDKDLP